MSIYRLFFMCVTICYLCDYYQSNRLHRQYMIIALKDKPIEMWNLKTMTLLRQMPKKFPYVSAIVGTVEFKDVQ